MDRTFVALVTFFLAVAAQAQTPGIGDTRPADAGAGAAQAPIERGATSGTQAEPPTTPHKSESDRALNRCNALSGNSLAQCLREERGAATGATRRAEPPSAPPPQNPR
jgi:hypothetical protein